MNVLVRLNVLDLRRFLANFLTLIYRELLREMKAVELE